MQSNPSIRTIYIFIKTTTQILCKTTKTTPEVHQINSAAVHFCVETLYPTTYKHHQTKLHALSWWHDKSHILKKVQVIKHKTNPDSWCTSLYHSNWIDSNMLYFLNTYYYDYFIVQWFLVCLKLSMKLRLSWITMKV